MRKNIRIADDKAKYDESCKRLLAEKMILAWIMKSCLEEYAEYDVKEIAEKYIEGTPQIASIAVLPDETNAPMIRGLNTEDATMTEGTITYDIRFLAIVPNSDEKIQLIINVEAQNDFYPGYPIIKRGIYYCARMISSQYGTVFTDSDYEKIQKVYSVWICMNPPKSRKNTITEYSFSEKNIIGIVKENEEFYDLMMAVMICLGKGAEAEDNSLLKLLDVLLSSDTKAIEKKEILENDFGIPMTKKMESEVEYMCNLSEGVEQKGIEKGIEKGRISTLCDLVRDNLITIKEAAKRADMTIEEFEIELNKPL